MTLFAVATKLDWADWIRGILGAFISGGAAAIGGGFGSIIADPEHFNVVNGGLAHVLTVMGVAFLFSAIISLAKFLQAHPVPDPVQSTSVAVSTTIQPGQPPKTTTTVTATSTEPPKPGV